MSLTAKWRGRPVFIRNRTSEEIEAATELAKKLTPEQLNAFFFSDRTGSA